MATSAGNVKYCIIGTGFSGTCALWHLVRRLTDPRRPSPLPPSAVTIVTVERGPVSGPGYPYAKDNVQLAHRCNNEAGTMGIHGNDFVDWMTESKPWLIRDFPELVLETHPGIEPGEWQPDSREFYPRALFGAYLRQRFQEAVDRAVAHGFRVRRYVRHEAVDGRTTENGFSVVLRDLATGREFTVDGIDRALLGIGHWQSEVTGPLSGHSGHVASPYPPDAVKAAVRDRIRARRARGERPRLFVQGMGPSGIDAILSLCDEGEFTHTPDGHVASYRPAPDREPLQVVAGSRSGFFPPVRGPLVPYEPHYVTEENFAAIRRAHGGQLKVEPVLELLDRELRRATDGTVGWADVQSPPHPGAREKLAGDLRDSYTGDLVHAIVLKTRRMRFYSRLAPSEKALYDRLFDTHFIRTAVPMPAANAEKLLALMDAGILTTVALGYDSPPVQVTEDGEFLITYRSAGGEPAVLRADCVIRARAQDFGMARHPSPLVRNLLRRGEIVPHQEGGYATGGIALETGGGYRVMKRSGAVLRPSPHLAAYGPPVRFWQNEKNYAGAFVEAAERVADDWIETGRQVMEMKEFHYQDGLRVSLFNLDHKAVPYHFHREVSDMMYCSRGQITIELPDTGEVFTVQPGEVFQVPSPSRHRFVNGAPVGTLSRYVLLQIGEFDINFVPAAQELAERFAGRAKTLVTNGSVYIENRKDDITELADRFERVKPEELTAEEQRDVVEALRSFAARGTETEHPRAAVHP